jgi:hypothetical protein
MHTYFVHAGNFCHTNASISKVRKFIYRDGSHCATRMLGVTGLCLSLSIFGLDIMPSESDKVHKDVNPINSCLNPKRSILRQLEIELVKPQLEGCTVPLPACSNLTMRITPPPISRIDPNGFSVRYLYYEKDLAGTPKKAEYRIDMSKEDEGWSPSKSEYVIPCVKVRKNGTHAILLEVRPLNTLLFDPQYKLIQFTTNDANRDCKCDK